MSTPATPAHAPQTKLPKRNLRTTETIGPFTYTTILVPYPTTPPTPSQEYTIITHVSPTPNPSQIIARQAALLLPATTRTTCFAHPTETPTHASTKREFQDFAFHLFGVPDRTRNAPPVLRPDLTTHPIRRGSGIWGNELAEGDFAYVEHLWTAPAYRGRGIARALLRHLAAWGDVIFARGIRWIFTWPAAFEVPRAWLRAAGERGGEAPASGDLEDEETLLRRFRGCALNAAAETERRASVACERAQRFWRGIGARRIGWTWYFGVAVRVGHASWRGDVGREPVRIDDLVPLDWCDGGLAGHGGGECERAHAARLRAEHPMLGAAVGSVASRHGDECFLVALQSYRVEKGWVRTLEMLTEVVLGYGSLMHYLGRKGFVRCLGWLVRTFGIWAREVRNHQGRTPWEELAWVMEADWYRRRETFRGFREELVRCLLVLEGNMEPGEEEVAWEARGSRFRGG